MVDAGEGSSLAPSGHILVPENRNRRAASHWLVVFSRVGFRPLLIQAQPFPQPAQPASVGAIHTRPTIAALLLSLGAKRGRRNCGAADGACVSRIRDKERHDWSAPGCNVLGRAPPGVLDVPGQGK